MALFDLVLVQSATTGTGTLSLGAAVDGGRTFAAAGVPDGATVSYAIADVGQREVGRGVYSAAGQTLTRSMTGSTTGALLNLSGAATVGITALADDFTAAAPTSYRADFAVPTAPWIVNHNLGRNVAVQTFTVGGTEFMAEVVVVSNNQIRIEIDLPQTGFAVVI